MQGLVGRTACVSLGRVRTTESVWWRCTASPRCHVAITGYLARRSDLAKACAPVPEGVRHSSTVLGAGSFVNARLDTRTVQRVRSHELDARPAR